MANHQQIRKCCFKNDWNEPRGYDSHLHGNNFCVSGKISSSATCAFPFTKSQHAQLKRTGPKKCLCIQAVFCLGFTAGWTLLLMLRQVSQPSPSNRAFNTKFGWTRESGKWSAPPKLERVICLLRGDWHVNHCFRKRIAWKAIAQQLIKNCRDMIEKKIQFPDASHSYLNFTLSIAVCWKISCVRFIPWLIV